MKNYLKKIKQVATLLTTLLLVSCSENLYEEETEGHAQHSNIIREKVNFKKFSDNKDAFAIYSKIKTRKNLKNVDLNSLDFEVNFENGIHLNYADLESYTFPITRKTYNGLLENIVISKHTDGNYYAKILKYNLTKQEKLDLKNGILQNISRPIQTEILGEINFGNSVMSDCGSITISITTACVNGHTSRSACNLRGAAAPRTQTFTIAADCESGGGGFNLNGNGSGGFYGNPFTGIGGNGGGGYITPAFPNETTPTNLYENGISEPVADFGTGDSVHPIVAFFGNLNDQQSLWASQQDASTIQSIIDYLNANNVSTESKEFIKNLIDYSTNNSITPEAIEENNNILSLLTNGTVNELPVDLGDSTPITNMTQYLSCFNISQSATLTISADQPDAGDHDLFTLNGGVGHSFITIKQGNKVRSLGFYPKVGTQSIIPNLTTPDPNDFINTTGEFHNNQSTSYDVSLSVTITASQLSNLINGTVNHANNNPVYNLSSFNCTDVAIIMFETNTNVNLPSCESPNILWDGQTPGTLGEIIRNLPTPTGGIKDTNGGTSPPNNG